MKSVSLLLHIHISHFTVQLRAGYQIMLIVCITVVTPDLLKHYICITLIPFTLSVLSFQLCFYLRFEANGLIHPDWNTLSECWDHTGFSTANVFSLTARAETQADLV